MIIAQRSHIPFAMRTFLLSLAVVPTLLFAQTPAKTPEKGIKWVSIEEAQTLVKKSPRPIMVDVHTSWCGPCKMLEAKTFSDPRLAEYVNKLVYALQSTAKRVNPVGFKVKVLPNPDFNPANTAGRNGPHQLP